jgi:hypothetical protein
MGPDVTCRRFTAGVSSDAEGNVRWPSVMLKARRSWRCGSASILAWWSRLRVMGALVVTVSPSPQSKDEENEKLHELRRYARDFRRQHMTDAERFNWDSDDEDYGLAIGRLVVT